MFLFLSILIPILLVVVFLVYASFDISSGVYMQTFCRDKMRGKQLALTFDDGPHPVYTLQTLEILRKYRIKATFFVIGKNIEGNEHVLRRVLDDGHQIGNHSFSHHGGFPFLSAKHMAEDLLRCEKAVSSSTGGYQTCCFRPPFGVSNPLVAKAVKIMDYQSVGWSIRSLDTVIEDRDKVVKRVVARFKPGAVILLHDTFERTPYILERVILHALEQGYTFYALSPICAATVQIQA